ncbi:hypothetical protein PHYC_02961 [Phycisphaerales bacterium]|nr:hypothetical protein PHYC_02961 [Phycisphaerales bacterium]
MKEFITFQGMDFGNLGLDLYSDLQTRFPECCTPGRNFLGGYPNGHPRLKEILEFLADHGWYPGRGWFQRRGPKEYWLRIKRHYDKKDFDAFEYLIFGGGGTPWSGGRVPQSPHLLLSMKNMKVDDVRMVGMQGRVVPERVRRILEAEQIRHIVFLPTLLAPGWPTAFDRFMSWEDMHEEPWWEIQSDLRLPPLSSRCRLVDAAGEPYNPHGPFKGLYVEEGNYENPEMHYRASDLAQLPSFDIALTHENFGAGNRDEIGTLVVSQRFRQVCIKHNLKVGFWPVRVDPE